MGVSAGGAVTHVSEEEGVGGLHAAGVNAIVGDAPQEEESVVSMVEVDEHAKAC